MSVNGYWLIKDQTTGHAALVGKLTSTSPAQTPSVSPQVYQQLGAKSSDHLVSYYLGGDPKNLQAEVEKALGKLQISTDQIPQYDDWTQSPLVKKGILALNFDLPTPIGVDPNKYQQALGNAGNAVASSLSLTSLFGSSSLWAGIGMALLGAFLVLFGIIKLSGADPKQVAKKVIR